MSGNGDARSGPAASRRATHPWPPSWRVLVLDDDPTGVQTLAEVPVFLEWTAAALKKALRHRPAVHLLTNSRALAANEARALVGQAARAARSAWPKAAVVLRGDSTLRGHLLEEYLAVADEHQPNYPPLLLAPALPSAGRITIGGVQYLDRDGRRIPVHQSEFAEDESFAYSSSRLLEWAEQRSNGFFKAANGIELQLEAIRHQGPHVVAEALERAERLQAPVVLAADSETVEDIETVANGYRLAVMAGSRTVLRCGPAFVGALEGTTAAGPVAMPAAERILLVSGSYVPQSARQLAQVRERFPGAVCEVDPRTLASGTDAELATIAGDLSNLLDQGGLAALTTPTTRQPNVSGLETGLRVARGLARIVAAIAQPGTLAILKGGVTSAVTLRYGLAARQATVIGPVMPGVALWEITDPSPRSALVVPGNVGDDQLLVRLIELGQPGT